MYFENMTAQELVDLVLLLQDKLKAQTRPQLDESSEEGLYKVLAHSSQVGFYLTQNKRFVFVNRHFQEYAGYGEAEMLAMDPAIMIHPEDRDEATKNTISMLKGQRFSPYEFRIITGDGRIKWVMETVISVMFKGQRAILGNLMDLTERKEAGKRLEELEALEASILDAIPQAVMVLHQRRIKFSNNAVQTIFGWHQEDLIGKSIKVIYRNDEEANIIAERLYLALEKNRTFMTEYPCCRKDGREILCVMRASRVGNKLRDRDIVVTYEDITEQKEAEKELKKSRRDLRNLSAHLQSVREEESSRIAREIHDELGQALTALQMDLSWLQNRIPKEEELFRDKTARMSQLLDSTVESVHRIMRELRPSVLDDLGLSAAIEWQINDFQERSGIQSEVLLCCSEADIDKELATTVFRIFQEALTNIARHSKATRFFVSLTEDVGGLCLEVKDNGVGITQEQVNNQQSFGILGMRERAHLWGGSIGVVQVHPQGTKVTLTIPFDRGVNKRDDTDTGCG